ncbi:peptide ABC transporter substrate-binding protein [uncultured Fretibacterium sp.]|uniref:peptide ABC transporter substrate-binding protein n=1 Tax=uncultured Fretibacterium sp. TaxID=1678694 RepID=UPI00260578FF|nr:peptide ABC transporter substrate-binding protein [uncultured Fretibacterium sp.]
MARSVRCLLALMAALFLAGTGAAAEGEIVFNLAVEPQTIDPVRNNAVDGSNVIFNLFDGLVRIGFDDAPEPGCAERWEVSEDGMTWTFHLRKGLKWSDGKPLTAEDFRYGLLRLLDARNASPNAYMAYFLKNGEAFFNGKAGSEDVGIDVPDDATLRLRLENPAPLMLDCLSFYAFAPARADVVEQDPRGWATKPESLVCNGPFVLSEWKHNSELTLTKNPNYWDADNVKIDKVRLVMITDSNTALAAFKAGKIDLLDRIPPQMTPQLIQSGEAKVAPTLGTSFSVFNVAKAPFDNPKVRRAFALAIDRTAMVEKVAMGGQKPAVAFIPYGIPGVGADKDFRAEGEAFLPERADPEAAKKLLAEAGYPDGKGFPKVTYKYNLNPINKAIAEALQAMWKQNLGIEVGLANEEWKVFIDTRMQKNFDIARHAYLVDFFDAGSLLELWMTGFPENVANYSNAEYDALMKDSLKQMDRSKRMEDMHRAEAILMRDLPVLPLYFYSTPYMQSARVKGVYISPRNWVFFRGVEVVE